MVENPSGPLRASHDVHALDNHVHDLIAVANDLRSHLTDSLARVGYEGLRPSFAPLFARLWAGGIALGQLADALGVSLQAASQSVALAEELGYVVREPNPADGRSKLVSMTPRGRQFVRDGAAAASQRANDYAEYIGVRPFRRLVAGLVALQRAAGAAGATALVTSITPGASIASVVVVSHRALAELHSAVVDAGHSELRETQNTMLLYVSAGGAQASQIARTLHISRQAVTSSLNELESLGYLTRGHHAADGRAVVFTLSPRGRRLVAAYERCIDRLESRYAQVLGDDYAPFAAAAHELRGRIHLERAIDDHRTPVLMGGNGGRARAKSELVTLAGELHRWLGDGDAARLGAILSSIGAPPAQSKGRR